MPARDRVALRPLRDMHRRGGERRSASCVDFLNRALIAGRHLGRNVQYSWQSQGACVATGCYSSRGACSSPSSRALRSSKRRARATSGSNRTWSPVQPNLIRYVPSRLAQGSDSIRWS